MYCILVAGMPASGKSTIAVRISKSLGIPMLSKDSIKEVLFDDLGFHSRAEKVQLGTAAMHILYYAAARGYTRFQANGPVLEVDVTDLSELDFPRLMGSLTGFVQRAVPGYPLRLPTRNAQSHRK